MFAPGITKKILALSWPGVGLVVFVYISIIYAPGITPIFGLVIPGACRWIYFWNLSKLQTFPKIGWQMYVEH